MIATLTSKPRKGMNTNHRKEQHYKESYVGLAITVDKNGKTEINEGTEMRIYQTSASAYACLWVYSADCYTRGSGQARGYGYHRASAAAQEAINAAGIDLSESISGCGDWAINDAIAAITRTLYPDASIIHVVNTHA